MAELWGVWKRWIPAFRGEAGQVVRVLKIALARPVAILVDGTNFLGRGSMLGARLGVYRRLEPIKGTPGVLVYRRLGPI